ncbi:MAG: hypothetical protein H6Q02_212 [Acidobacteria bacterium]|jgi:hypothetical protein|nr:hypothetical protein [Acidobacteriota bacterium]
MADTYPPTPPPITPGGSPPPVPPVPPATAPLPWEQPGYPFLEALYETAKLLVTAPTEAFRRVSVTVDLGRPLLYAILLGWIGIIAGQLYSIALRGVMTNLMPFQSPEGFAMGTGASIAVMVLAPVFVLLGIFIWSAIVHLFLMMVGGANAGFGATVRVMCYGTTAQLAQVVPLCGGIVGAVWAIVLEIIGLAQVHRTSQGKAALAVLLPLALCCVCIAIMAALFGAAIMAAIGQSGS